MALADKVFSKAEVMPCLGDEPFPVSDVEPRMTACGLPVCRTPKPAVPTPSIAAKACFRGPFGAVGEFLGGTVVRVQAGSIEIGFDNRVRCLLTC